MGAGSAANHRQPLAEARLGPAGVAEAHGSTSPRPTAVVADDEFHVVELIAMLLETLGVQVVKAYDGEQALQAVLELRPRLLITDVVMPGISGTEAAISISKFLPECKTLLFLDSVIGKELAESARSRGFNFELIEKPLHPQELLQKIRSSFH